MEKTFREALSKSPVIAILRHLPKANAQAVGEALVDAGVTLIEVPLNGREALASVEVLTKALHREATIGVGTVLSPEDVSMASACGARFVLSPNTNPEIIGMTKRLGLWSIPGVATPTEAFAALKNGAHALKLFPGQQFPPDILKAWRVVLPPDTPLIMSGGVTAGNVASYIEAGAAGFGVASAIFAPEFTPADIGAKAKRLMAAIKAVKKEEASCPCPKAK